MSFYYVSLVTIVYNTFCCVHCIYRITDVNNIWGITEKALGPRFVMAVQLPLRLRGRERERQKESRREGERIPGNQDPGSLLPHPIVSLIFSKVEKKKKNNC